MDKKQMIVCGAGSFHTALADRLQRIADTITTPLHVVTTEDIEKLSASVNTPMEDILSLIEQISAQKRLSKEDFESICIKSAKAFNEFSEAATPFIEDDNRPWYDKASHQGGKKRKQNYNNRQPWRK